MNGEPERVYAIVLKYSESNIVELHDIHEFVTKSTKVSLLGYNGELKVIQFRDPMRLIC